MISFDRPTILMCPPDYYGIEYEINPWMSRSRQSDRSLAESQWRQLRDLLASLGADIRTLTAVSGLPDLVFTANAGLVCRDRAYLSRFRHAARQPESSINAACFRELGLDVRELPAGWDFEGAGDALFCGETLWAGYLIRSDVGGEQWLAGELRCRVIPLQLVSDQYYHLDTCFCPLSPTEAIWHPPAFDEYGQAALRQHIPTRIEVSGEEAARFACNAVVLGRHVVLNTGCPKLEQDLAALGYEPHATELGEFIKAGGSAKCLTLRLDGEEAAIWP